MFYVRGGSTGGATGAVSLDEGGFAGARSAGANTGGPESGGATIGGSIGAVSGGSLGAARLPGASNAIGASAGASFNDDTLK